MTLSAAEKQKHYREYKKAEIGEAVVRENDAARKRLSKKRNIQAIREREKRRIAKYRAELNILKVTADPKQDMSPYSMSQKCTKMTSAVSPAIINFQVQALS